MRRSLAIAGLVVTGALLFAACGGSDDSSGMNMNDSSGSHMSDQSGMGHQSETMENQPIVAGAPEIPVEAGALSFKPKRLNLQAGADVTIVLTSTDIGHDFYVDGVGHIVHAAAGKTAKGGLMIEKPGTYKFWCSVKGHKEGGMVGTITVAAPTP